MQVSHIVSFILARLVVLELISYDCLFKKTDILLYPYQTYLITVHPSTPNKTVKPAAVIGMKLCHGTWGLHLV